MVPLRLAGTSRVSVWWSAPVLGRSGFERGRDQVEFPCFWSGNVAAAEDGSPPAKQIPPRCGVPVRVERTEIHPPETNPFIAPLNAARSWQRDDPTARIHTVPLLTR